MCWKETRLSTWHVLIQEVQKEKEKISEAEEGSQEVWYRSTNKIYLQTEEEVKISSEIILRQQSSITHETSVEKIRDKP